MNGFFRRNRAPRQDWKPHWSLRIVNRTWRIALSCLKVLGCALATVTIIGIVCGFVFVNFLGDYLQGDVSQKAEINLDDYNLEKTSYIYSLDENGDIQILQRIYTTTDRRWASYDELPEELINACVAIEDKRFYEHQGVDWITTMKACVNMFMGGSSTFGGSTITQQLIKNLFEADDVTVQRKVLEIFRAQAFEKKYDKDVVMEWYMNTIFFGEGCYGVKSAAENYFGKELQDMTTAECAALIGITNNPSLFNPYSKRVFTYEGVEQDGAGRNRSRQRKILTAMRDQGWLNEEDYLEAYHQELVYKRGIAPEDKWTFCKDVLDNKGDVVTVGCGYDCAVRDLVTKEENGKTLYFCPSCGQAIDITTDASQAVYSWYVDQVIDDVAQALAERDGVEEWNKTVRANYVNLIARAGYHIYTPFDASVQEAVDKIYTDLEQIPTVRNGQQLQSAIVIVDNRTGDIVAMAGGVGEKDTFDAWNRATDAKLQVGSSMKPLTVYAPAFELGVINPVTVVDDLPISYNDKNPFPLNDSRQYHSARTIWRGIVSSVNAVSVNTLDTIGLQYSYNFAKNKFGISTLVDSYTTANGSVLTDMGYSPLGMGGLTFGATVRDVTCAYGTFANNGVYREGRTFTKVYDSDGNLVIDNEQVSEQILSEKTVTYMNYCLDLAVQGGTGRVADFAGMNISGKTGTTSNNKDRYFCGYTGYYTGAVWSGYDQPEKITVTKPSGLKNPSAYLWKQVMQPIHKGLESKDLFTYDNMVEVTVCLDSGKLATPSCSQDIRDTSRVYTVFVYPEDMPKEFCDCHVTLDYCTEGGGVANDYCHKFENVGALLLTSKSLVKRTQAQVEELFNAKDSGLKAPYLRNDYIYLINSRGEDVPFYGISGDLSNPAGTPYISCPVHTKESWDAYVADHPWVDGGTATQPTEPAQPTDPTDSTEPEGGEEEDNNWWWPW